MQEQALVFPGEQSSEANKAAAPRAEPKAAAAPPRSTANVTVPAAEPLPTAPAAVEDADLDGLELGQGAGALPEPPKAKPLAAARAPPAVSKKDAQKAKRAAGVGSAKRAIATDSSDEEDSSGAESEGEGEGAAAADGPSRPPAKQTPRAAAPARATPKSAPGSQKFLTLTPTLVLALTRRGCAPRSFQGGRQAALEEAQPPADEAPVQDPHWPGGEGRRAAH